MRIISGTHKSRRIEPPGNLPVRPTTDMAKEALFNILHNNFYLEDIHVCDLFAGTGNISFEFASRGAQEIVSVDSNIKCISFIKATSEKLGFENITTFCTDVFRFINKANKKFDIIFADPPYQLESISQIPDLILNRNLLTDEAWLILEHSKSNTFKDHNNFYSGKKYGSVNFSIFRK